MRFDRSEAAPKPVRTVSDDRPVFIEKSPKGVKFFDRSNGEQISRSEAIDLMRAYHGKAPRSAEPTYLRQPKARKPRVEKPWTVAVYRTEFATKHSTCIASETAGTFAAAALKLASLCMEHVGDKQSAVEVLIEQAV